MNTDVIITGDNRKILAELPGASVDLLITDPPYNIGFKYDHYRDSQTAAEFRSFLRCRLLLAARCLRPSGSAYVMMGDEHVADVKTIMDDEDMGLTFRNWIIWEYGFGQDTRCKFARCHAHILYYVRDGENFTFNADAVRVPSARQTVYDDPRANPAGKVPGDVWHVPRLCGTFRERTGHPCQLPVTLVERMVLASSNPGDVILDPFCGSGTVCVAAKKRGRRYIGIELSDEYADASRERLRKTRVGLAAE